MFDPAALVMTVASLLASILILIPAVGLLLIHELVLKRLQPHLAHRIRPEFTRHVVARELRAGCLSLHEDSAGALATAEAGAVSIQD